MGIAALVLGILSFIVAYIPCLGGFMFIPAVVGLVLGIVDLVTKTKKNLPKGMSIAGIVLSSIALIVITLNVFVFGMAFSSYTNDLNVNELVNEIRNEIENNI